MSLKKTLASLLVAGAAILGTANKADSEVIFSENFDNQTTEQVLKDWDVKYEGTGALVEVDEQDYSGEKGKSLRFLDTGGRMDTILSKTFSNISELKFEFDILTKNMDNEGIFVRLSGNGGTDYTLGISNGVYGGMRGYIGVHGAPQGWIKPNLLQYKEDTWYHVERELNCQNNTGFLSVSEIGNPLNSVSYSIGSAYPNDHINKIWIYSSYSQGADGNVDNLRLTSIPEPGTLEFLVIAGLAGAGVFALRKKR